MRLICRLIASIWILYRANTKAKVFRRFSHLLCGYFSSNSNQYCTSSKPAERQLSMRFLCLLIPSIWILFTARSLSRWKFTTGAVPCQYLRRTGQAPNYKSAGNWQSVLVQYYQLVQARQLKITQRGIDSQYWDGTLK